MLHLGMFLLFFAVLWHEAIILPSPQLFKSFEFGNGSRMSDDNLVILEFKYLHYKKW